MQNLVGRKLQRNTSNKSDGCCFVPTKPQHQTSLLDHLLIHLHPGGSNAPFR
jgi:hypothetical protein